MSLQPEREINWKSEIIRLKAGGSNSQLIALAIESALAIDPTVDFDPGQRLTMHSAEQYKIETESLAAGLLLRAGEHKLAQSFIRSINDFLNRNLHTSTALDIASYTLPIMHGAIKAERYDLIKTFTDRLSSRLQGFNLQEEDLDLGSLYDSVLARLIGSKNFELADGLLSALTIRGRTITLSTAANTALESNSPQIVSWVLNRATTHLEVLEADLDASESTAKLNSRFDLLASKVAKLQLQQGLITDAYDTIKRMHSNVIDISAALGECAAFVIKAYSEKSMRQDAIGVVKQIVSKLISSYLPLSPNEHDKSVAINNFVTTYLKSCTRISDFEHVTPLLSHIKYLPWYCSTTASLTCSVLNIGSDVQFSKAWHRLINFVTNAPLYSKHSQFYNQNVLIYDIAAAIEKTVHGQNKKIKAYTALVDLAATLHWNSASRSVLEETAQKIFANDCWDQAERIEKLFEDGEWENKGVLTAQAQFAARTGDIPSALNYFDKAAHKIASKLFQHQIHFDSILAEAKAELEETPSWASNDETPSLRQELNELLVSSAGSYSVMLEYCREFLSLATAATKVGLHEKASEFFSTAADIASKIEGDRAPVAYYLIAESASHAYIQKREWQVS